MMQSRSLGRSVLGLLLSAVLVACGGGGGLGADGGVSGSGISSVTGNVTEVTTGNGNVGGIRVRVEGTDVETVTGDDGSFTLSGEFDGPVTVVFELDDGGRAETRVDVPPGGNVDLEDVVVDPEREEARPTRRTISFAGIVEVVDCLAGTLVVLARRDGGGTRFTVRLGDAFVHDPAGAPVACEGIRVGDEATVQGEVLEGGTIAASDVEIRRPAPTPTVTPQIRPTATADRPGPERTLVAPRPTATPRVDDRPRPTEPPLDVDQPQATVRPPATPTVTPLGDRPRPAATATARVAPRP